LFYISLLKLKDFDKITRFRLINGFWFALILGLTSPVFSHLKGLLAVSILSAIVIGSQLIMKTHDWWDKKFTIAQIYKFGIFLNIAFCLSTALYFYDKKLMILLDSILGVLELGIYGVYSIKLNDFISQKYPETFRDFQKVKNAVWADGMLLGLILTMIISYFFNEDLIIKIVLVIWSAYILRMLLAWKFLDNLKGF